ncbi:protein translocase subunit SecF [Sphingomonas sp. ABOLG]|jgi:preprotein translocase subunit SecF|uniref:Protein-export membrane protein SecF n=1 Tax=Sphingomonas olei TaxID=1886787 RepID=A0ABY2QJY2_9SPHN|nr:MULTISPECIES: protein translocase subunit SecF [Sphingomonas]KKI19150.1 preprotein translocase subunit SecF [Sphingomonas sp. Ag1]RSV17617.1 protein translocase subunit SecF [Sphingomonas sp. ABOLG]THG41410.1 protein translocase subunit SecF [Sphingomonas olei]
MKLLKLVPDDTNFDFVRLRSWAFGLTLILSVLAIGVTFAKGLNFGVDFEGGLMIEERFASPPDLDKLRSVVDAQGLGEASLQQFGDPRTLTIRLPVQEGADEGATNAAVKKVEVAIAEAFPGATFSRYSTISGKVSGELIRNGILAVVLSILGIGLFAIVRFEWQFGVSTIAAIIHDLLMTLGFFALTQFEFDLNIVAAVLTIVGYSINDKIVIDDRIRENMRRYRKMDMREIVNLSVNETLPRTVMTSVTILLALGALLFLGGHVLRGFTAAMILGIVVGTYSSIYVSSSLLITLGLRSDPSIERAPRGGGIDNAERIAPREPRAE